MSSRVISTAFLRKKKRKSLRGERFSRVGEGAESEAEDNRSKFEKWKEALDDAFIDSIQYDAVRELSGFPMYFLGM